MTIPLADAICLFVPNPRYWQYKQRPVRLLGGSIEDNLFQIDHLADHLDLLHRVGGNYVRNTMSSRDPGNVWPYVRRADGRHDLTIFDERYWQKFTDLLELAVARDIIVQIELWDRFDFSRESWLQNPFNPQNNLNYNSEQSGLAETYPAHPKENQQPFFYTVPAEQHNRVLLPLQHAFIEKLLSISLAFPNVLYCMDNETCGSPQWGGYWADFVKAKAAAAGKTVYVTEMWDPWDIAHPLHGATFDHPERYDFVDISQNNQLSGETHWGNMQKRWHVLHMQPRPMNTVKTYGATGNKFGHTDDDGIARFWRGLVGGVAALRFHRPPSGLGLNETAQACIRSAQLLLAEWAWLHSTPDSYHSQLDAQRPPDSAYLSHVGNQQFVVYFPRGEAAVLHTGDGRFSIRWLDILARAWSAAAVVNGPTVALNPPNSRHWVAFLDRHHTQEKR